MDHNKLWKILTEMGIVDHLTCFLRNLYEVKKQELEPSIEPHTGKGVHQGCILSTCLFNFHAEYIMWNDGLDDSKAGIKIARRKISNLRYADDSTLMAESKEELKSIWIRVKEESKKADLKLNIQKTTAIWPSNPIPGHTHWENQNWKRHVYPNVHHSTVYNSQDMEAT